MIFDFCPSGSGNSLEEHVGDDEAEHRVAEELERLVVDDAAGGVLVRARPMRQRVLEQAAIAKAIADAPLERGELVANAHDAAARLGAPRWLSISRRASSASAAGTASRNAPASLTLVGKIDCSTSASSMTSMPCASSRPRTTSASIGELLREDDGRDRS